MSIIHDALKKVQQTKPAAVPPSRPPAQAQYQPQPNQQDDKINIPLLVAAICAIVAMIFAALPYIALKMNQVPPQPMAAAPRAPNKPTPQPLPSPNAMTRAITSALSAPAVFTPSITIPPTKPHKTTVNSDDPVANIQVEGILDMKGKKAALINGNIYEEGQTIYGKVIVEITFNSLTIIDNGQKRTLSIKP
ncbi:MAG: hypothetical protein HQL17_01595 [Candidatus Omnitrophica bacterium]|nr:hypothetical protein [Candidatus Omnitrophota bacterium]